MTSQVVLEKMSKEWKLTHGRWSSKLIEKLFNTVISWIWLADLNPCTTCTMYISLTIFLFRFLFSLIFHSLSKLRAKKVEKLHILVIKQLLQMTAYRKFRKWNTGIRFWNRKRLFPVDHLTSPGLAYSQILLARIYEPLVLVNTVISWIWLADLNSGIVKCRVGQRVTTENSYLLCVINQIVLNCC
jgi:hypothetical protein